MEVRKIAQFFPNCSALDTRSEELIILNGWVHISNRIELFCVDLWLIKYAQLLSSVFAVDSLVKLNVANKKTL